jgi:ubiquinol-cytochrome c reductase core subunit 2
MTIAHEFHEDVERSVHLKQGKLESSALPVALDLVHATAFHKGLGLPLYPTSSTPIGSYLNESSVSAFAESAFIKSNIALVADGASQSALSKWAEQFMSKVPTSPGALALDVSPSKYYGGEQRLSHTSSNAMVIAFPTSGLDSLKPEFAVLAALLGGQSNVKWAPGFSLLSKVASFNPGVTALASNLVYSDAGLLTIQLSGSASAIREAATEAINALKSISSGSVGKEDLAKAAAKARFDALESDQGSSSSLVSTGSGIIHSGKPYESSGVVTALASVTPEKLKAVSKNHYSKMTKC